MPQIKIKHVLGLSGGKDSSALALYVKETRPELDIEYFFTDTGYELPETNEFIDQLEEKLGYIHRLNARSLNNIEGRGELEFKSLLKKHQNYLPSQRDRWCTVQMKLKPFEQWVDGFIENILQRNGLELPAYYSWRSRSGCSFCFFQKKIEWVRLKENHPDLFEQAKQFEKGEGNTVTGESFYWMGKGEPLETLEDPVKKASIIANHEKKVERFKNKRRRNALLGDIGGVSEMTDLDEIYDDVEGGGACVTCYK
jgi:3'-phosphoadenosine 5'-phosphosulfate sulfotransferase (PAPS reductase)/FAD synthetase